ncbi:MBL fold metallo-hydrolase, partial [Candidatus Uhrbacteria bacterium]|nr:MBL fold metallo-hydrolase [Candidatus Uhrbacteria bacterium]
MNFFAVGGGDEIGASCYLLRIAGRNIVVDSGVRFKEERRTEPADLDKLKGKRIDAIFITHGHIDHIGAIPLLAAQHPEAEIYATVPTIAIGSMLLKDSIKVAGYNKQTPLFGWGELDDFRWRVIEIESPDWFSPWPNWRVSFWPAGHMRGAASILIDSPKGKAMFSGDVSFYDTPVVKGARLPENFQPDLLITDST